MSNSIVTDLKRALKTDERFVKMHRAFVQARDSNLKLDELDTEVQSLHKTRMVRVLNVNSHDIVHKLLESNALEQAYRSRLTEILIVCFRVENMLKDTLELLSKYVLSEYEQHLASIKTKGERENVVTSVLAQYATYLSRLRTLIKITQLVIDDIDKCSYRLSDMMRSLTLTLRPEKQL